MRNVLFPFLLIFILISCKEKGIPIKEILVAEDKFNEFFKYQFNLRLLSDSTYIFTYNENEWSHEKNEIYRGRYLSYGDSIYFTPFRFEYTASNKAVLKDNFIEFLNGKRPFRIKISKTSLDIKSNIDTIRFNDYSVFTYDSGFYKCFSGAVKPVDLNNIDLVKIDSLINICIIQNKSSISRMSSDYFKQVIAILNSKNEKEVWINFLCKNSGSSKYYRYNVIHVDDGGSCFLRLKINLNELRYYDLSVNGPA
jgi:hypothetical protein